MRVWLLSLLLLGFSASAGSNFHTVVMDTDCFSYPRQFPFEFVKHNASIHQKIQAYRVKVVGEVELNDPCILSLTADADFKLTNDPMRSEQTYLDRIDHAPGSEIFFSSSFAVQVPAVIGIVDTGVEYTHPDLRTQMWPSLGFDFINEDNNPMDDNGHGTHVAGLIGAARNNGLGIEGVMGRGVQIMALKSQDQQGDGLLADVVNAVRWGADNGADVLNLSLASKIRNQAMEDAIAYAISKGTVVVVAAGNDGELITSSNFVNPASYAPQYAGLLSVGSLNVTDLAASPFSNFSPSFVEVAAVGQDGLLGVWSTFLNGSYKKQEGTSMAAPQVSGAAGLAVSFLKTQGYSFTPANIESIIKNSSVSAANIKTSFQNGQRLNIERLGHYLLNATVLSSTGGFDENP